MRLHPAALVVEDDAALSRLYSGVLRFAGLDVETVGDGWAALQSVEASKPDIVLLDLDLPRLDGGSVFRELRRRRETHDIPILIVTGHGELLAAVRNGDVRALRKPLEPEVLVREVCRLLHWRPVSSH